MPLKLFTVLTKPRLAHGNKKTSSQMKKPRDCSSAGLK